MKVPMMSFGFDHWKLFDYIAYRCDNPSSRGKLESHRIRCNKDKHDMINAEHAEWTNDYGTRLADGGLIEWHDDLHCAEDMMAEGLIIIHDHRHVIVELTPLGKIAANALRNHKRATGSIRGFQAVEFHLEETDASDSK